MTQQASAVPASGSARPAGGAGSPAHPFSDPIYFPLRSDNPNFDVRMGCTVANGCASGTNDQSINLLTPKQGFAGGEGNYVHAPVYAAGAGIVHVGAANTKPCGPSAPPLGNWMWIDHGGGVVTRYAHLYHMQTPTGTYVTPGTLLGYTGNSGARSTCYVDYLYFQVQGSNSTGQTTNTALTTLQGCSGTTPVTLPSYWNRAWTTFPTTPNGSLLTPVSNTDCVPTSVPLTPSKPAMYPLVRSGSGSLTMRWRAPVHNPTSIQLELRQWHPANHTWSYVFRRNFRVGSTMPTSYRVYHLINGTGYDGRVSFHNSVGWSAPSNWTATQSPAAH